MSLPKLLRTPLSIGLALSAVAAGLYKKSKSPGTTGRPAHAPVDAAKNSDDRNADVTRLARRLLISTEEEKSRIARDLHDGLGSTLTAVNLDLFWVQQRLADQPALAGRLGRAIEVLASTVEIKRRIIHSLRPAALDNLGLTLAIESNVAEFEKTSDLPVSMDLPSELPAMTEHSSIALFRIYQDALACAACRRGVTRIAINMREESGGVSVEVIDDGIIDPAGDAHDTPAAMALLTMRERAAALDGTLTVVHGAAERGTTVRAFLPRPFRAPAEPALAET